MAHQLRAGELDQGPLYLRPRGRERADVDGCWFRVRTRKRSATAHDELDKFGDGLHLQFFHNATAMHLNGLFGGAQFCGGLLVEKATEKALQDFAFAAGERIEAVADVVQFVAFPLRVTFLEDGFMNELKEVLLMKRRDEKVKGAGLNDFDAGRDIGMAGNKNHGQARMSFVEVLLNCHAVAAGQVKINDGARGRVHVFEPALHVFKRGESGRPRASGL